MPVKSKHGKGKHPHSRKSKSIKRQSTMAVEQSVPADKPVPEATIEKPSVPKVSAESQTKVIQNPYIVNELRRIGILAGIILVVLIILAITLS
jgi:hypothetical protein